MAILLIRIFLSILVSLLILKPVTVSAETVAIPLFLNYPQLQLLMKKAMFTGPDNSVRYLLDDDGCNTVSFSQPNLSAAGEGLRLSTHTSANIGANTTGGCMTVNRWAGRTVITGKPLLINRQPLAVQFQVQAVALYDQQGRQLSDSLLPQSFKAPLHRVLSRFHMDLKPATNQLKVLLPDVVPRYSADRLTRMLDSLRIGHVKVRPKGLDDNLI